MDDIQETREFHDPATSYLEIYDRWMSPRKHVAFGVFSIASAAVDFAGVGTYYVFGPIVDGVLSTIVGLGLFGMAYWESRAEA